MLGSISSVIRDRYAVPNLLHHQLLKRSSY